MFLSQLFRAWCLRITTLCLFALAPCVAQAEGLVLFVPGSDNQSKISIEGLNHRISDGVMRLRPMDGRSWIREYYGYV